MTTGMAILVMAVLCLMGMMGFLALWLLRAQREAAQASRTALREEFAALAVQTLQERAGDLSAQNAAQVRPLFDQLKETFTELKTAAEAATKSNIALGAGLSVKLDEVGRRAQSLGQQADEFVTAIKGGNKVQGNWGEGILAKALEDAGLKRGVNFVEQTGSAGAGLPDVTVFDGAHRKILIDAKVNITHFIAAANASRAGDEALARQERQNHAKSVRQQIKGLAERKYAAKLKAKDPDEMADYAEVVVMMMPSEATYAAAVTADPELPAYANGLGVALASPQMLFGYLVLFKTGMDRLQVERNQQEIARRAEQLIARMDAAFVELEKVDKALEDARASYLAALGKLGGASNPQNVLVPAREIVQLVGGGDRLKAKLLRLTAVAAVFSVTAAFAGGVRMETSTIVRPAPDGTDETCRYLTLANDGLQAGLLPEQGIGLFSLTDRRTGEEAFSPRTSDAAATPFDWKLVTDKRTGKKSIWIGKTELRSGLKWSIGLSLPEDRAVLQAKAVFMNRGPVRTSLFSRSCDSNRVDAAGGKFFLWRSAPDEPVWNTVLTDGDGPCFELLMECGNGDPSAAPSIAPYETRTVRQVWFPVRGIGDVKDATIDGAVNVTRLAKRDELFVGFHSTRVLRDCTVTVRRGEETVFSETGVAIAPSVPWRRTVKVSTEREDATFTAALADAAGRVFLSYTLAPGHPSDSRTLQGGRARRMDAGTAAADAGIGAAAADDSDIRRAVALEDQGLQTTNRAVRAAKFKAAEEIYVRLARQRTGARPAFVGLARLACLRGDFSAALAHVDAARAAGTASAMLHVMRAYVLRQLKRLTESSKELRLATAIDPLDAWGVAERAFLEDDGAGAAVKAGANRGLRAQRLLETVGDYWRLGAWREVAVLCDQANALARREAPFGAARKSVARDASCRNALFDVFGGAALEMMGYPDLARKRYAAAAAQPMDNCVPRRRAEYAALRCAAALCPELEPIRRLLVPAE